jgi:hypothetical protein
MERRHFLSGAAAATLAIPVFEPARMVGAAQAQATPDPIAEHILSEAVRLARQLKEPGRPRADTVAALAANFRLHAAHARSQGLDAVLARAVAREIRRRGRDNFIDVVSGPDMMKKHHEVLRSFGLEELHLETRALPREVYAERLPAILLGKSVTQLLDQTAASLELVSARIARLTTPQGGRLVQSPCTTLEPICQFLRAFAAWVCAVMAVDPALAPLCAVMGVEAATACFLAWAAGC